MTTKPGRIRLLHLITTFSVGGAEMHLLELVRGLDRGRFDITVAFFREEAREARSLAPDFRALGVEVVNLDMPRWWSLGALWRLYRLMRRKRFHIVHTHLFRADLFGPLTARLAGIGRVVTTIHNTERFFLNPLVRAALKLAGRRVSRLIGISHAVKRTLVADVGLPESGIEVIHYGIAGFEADLARREAVRRRLGLPLDAPVVGTIGRLARQKGHCHLIEAFGMVRAIHPGAHLLIAGHDDENLRGELERQAGPAVVLAGYLEATEALAAIDVFVLPSLWEGFGLVLLEAMSARLPIVATRVSAIPEIVVDGETGLLVPPADPGRLAEAICALLSDPGRANLLAARGHQRMREQFTLESMIARTETVYERVLAQS